METTKQLDLFPNERVMLEIPGQEQYLKAEIRSHFGNRTEICKAYRIKKKTFRWLAALDQIKFIYDKDGKTKLYKWDDIDLPLLDYKNSTKKTPPVNSLLLSTHFLNRLVND